MTNDENHLHLLSIFHYVVSGIAFLASLIPIFHVVLGIVFIVAPEQLGEQGEGAPPAFFGWMFAIIGTFCILVGMTFAALVLAAGRCLAKRKHYLYCMVMGGVECLFMPFGTVLGIFTIVVLMRESVQAMFEAGNS